MIRYGRQTDSRTTASLHGKYPKQGYETRSDRAEIPLRTWLPFPYQCEASARHTGHRLEEISHVHLRERVFLAWA